MPRINMGKSNKLGYAAVMGLEGYARKSVEPELYELIKLRASILNGCGFCVDMHATEGRKQGIPSRKLHAVAAWQHSKVFFDAREQAVLALTDAVTKLGPDTVTDEIWNAAATHFDDHQMGALIMAISTINVWNRIAVSTQMEPPVDEKNPIV